MLMMRLAEHTGMQDGPVTDRIALDIQVSKLYTDTLYVPEYGEALWHPTRHPNVIGDARLGDVGAVEAGWFCRIFNTLDPDEPINVAALPKDYEYLEFVDEAAQNIITEEVLPRGAVMRSPDIEVSVKDTPDPKK